MGRHGTRIAAIFGIITVLKGEGKTRVMGAIGLVLGVIGIIMGLIVLLSILSMINWQNITPEALQQFTQINPDDPQEVQQWLQQFFNVDLSSIMKYSN